NNNGDTLPAFNSYTGTDAWALNPCGTTEPCEVTDWIYGMYPEPNGYSQFAAAASGAGGAGSIYPFGADGDTYVSPDPATGGDCPNDSYHANFCYRNDRLTGQYAGGTFGATFVYPLGRMQIADLAGDGTLPPSATTIRLISVKPLISSDDVFEFSTAGLGFTTDDAADAAAALDLMAIVPNPYMGVSAYETGNLQRVVRFTNLPEVATIRVYTVAGTLIKTITKDGPSRAVDWDLQTDNNLPIASGMYLIHIDVPGVGERTLKFGVIQRQTRISVF
ncbi:MAG: T9SS type A sorting domain-containing protein, partial [Saprospiraceae bacterium]|nr:T9SS type A sorting domain-containing protein [Saprospiraceae bacterium]